MWPWLSSWGRTCPVFATDDADVDCGMCPFSLPCPSSLPRAGILGTGAAGGVGFCSLSEPHPAPGRCHLPHCKAGLGMCRPPGPAWRGCREGGVQPCPREGAVPGSPASSQPPMVGAGERGAPPASPPLSRPLLSGVQLPCLTLGAQFLPPR